MSESLSGGGSGQFSAEHRLRRLQTQKEPVRSAPRKPHIVRELALIVVVAVVAVLLWPQARVATADYPEARSLADRIQAFVLPVWQGEASFAEAVIPDDLRLYEFDINGRTTWIVTHPEPTAHHTCYGLRTGGGLISAAVRFAPTEGCVPLGGTGFEVSGSWEEVLPREWVTPLWFVPVAGLLALLLLGAATRIVTKLAFK